MNTEYKSTEEILKKYEQNAQIQGIDFSVIQFNDAIAAMEEYASQFKQPGISEELERLKAENVELKSKIYRQTMYNHLDHLQPSQQPIPTVDEDELWNEILNALGLGFVNREEFISQAKQQFSITRK